MRTGKDFFQSASLVYGAHEIGHLFDQYVRVAINNGYEAMGLTQESYNQIVNLHKEIAASYIKDVREGNTTDARNEYYATKIQNYFAAGLKGEPQHPSYSGTSVKEKTQAQKNIPVNDPTESKDRE